MSNPSKVRTPLKAKDISMGVRKRASELNAVLDDKDGITNHLLDELNESLSMSSPAKDAFTNSFDDKRYVKSKKHHSSICVFFEDQNPEEWEIALRKSKKPTKSTPKPLRLASLSVSPVKSVSRPKVEYDMVEYSDGMDGNLSYDSLSRDIFGLKSSQSQDGSVKQSSLFSSPTLQSSVLSPPIVLTNERVDKYFGVKAQHHFNATYRELIHRRNICVGGDDELISMVSALGNGSKSGSRCNSRGGDRLSPAHLSPQGSLYSATAESIASSVRQLRVRKVLSPISTGKHLSPRNEIPPNTANHLAASSSIGKSSYASSSYANDNKKKSFYSIPRKVSTHKTPKLTKLAQRYGLDESNSGNVSHLQSVCESQVRSRNNSIFSDITALEGEFDLQSLVGDDDESEASFVQDSTVMSIMQSENQIMPATIPPLQLNNVLVDDDAFKNEITLSTYSANSPRAKFLAGCIKCNLPPRALALLRHRFTTVLNLEHFGLGDQFGLLLSSSFAALPAVKVLNIGDNRFTDVSLGPMMKAIHSSKILEELNISANKIGAVCADALAAYIADPNCSLVSLVLNNSKITDNVCAKITNALACNVNVKELDLSTNLLGKDENLLYQSGLLSAGESLGALLRSTNGGMLRSLKLQWNMLRGIGGMDLCDSLRSSSNALVYLDLSYNSIGTDGGSVLGSALMDNKTLRELYIASNNIGPEACFTICVGAKESECSHICFDENPIGDLGCKMLMSLSISKRNLLTFSAIGCDFNAKLTANLIDLDDPVGQYELTMSSSLGRAILLELLEVVARNPVFYVKQFFYLPPNGNPGSGGSSFSDTGEAGSAQSGDWICSPIEMYEDMIQNLGELELALIEELTLQIRLVNDIEKVERVFNRHWNKGLVQQLTHQEFSSFLNDIGYKSTLRDALAIIRTLDNEDKDTITFEEIKHFLLQNAVRAKSQLKDVQFRTRCCLKSSPNVRYFPPAVGKVRIEISRTYLPLYQPRTITPCQVTYMHRAALKAHEITTMISYGVAMTLCHLKEGDMIVNMLKKDMGDTVLALAVVLPRMVNTEETAKLVRIHAGNSYERRQKLKAIMGHSYNPLLGHFDGFYSLHLALETDRLCFIKLLECSLANAAMRKKLGLSDLSQCGDWYCFRNQVIDGEVCITDDGQGMRITHEAYTPMPKSGRVEFDFSSCHRPELDVLPIHDHKMVRLLHECGLMEHSSHYDKFAHKFLDEMKRGCARAMQQGYSYWSCEQARSTSIEDYLHNKFYLNLKNRHLQHVNANRMYSKPGAIEASDNSEVKQTKLGVGGKAKISSKFGSMLGSSSTPKTGDVDNGCFASFAVIEEEEEDDAEIVENINDPNLLGRMNMRSPLKSQMSKSPGMMSPLLNHPPSTPIATKAISQPRAHGTHMPSFTKSMMQMVARDLHTARPTQKFKNYKRFQSLDSIFNMLGPVQAVPVQDYFSNYMATHYMLSRHLALLVHLYDDGRAKHSDFGTYRVELIVSLFNRVVDLHNFELVLMQLSSMEHACVIGRLGILSIFNPWKPDGYISLNMARWDEMQVVKMMIHLYYGEPGNSAHGWISASVRSSYDSPVTQGWVLNELWKSEEGLQKNKSALLTIRYSTGDGLRLNNMCPNRSLRNSLLALVLTDPGFITEGVTYDAGSKGDELTVANANNLLSACKLTFTYSNKEVDTVNWQEI